MYPNSPLTPDAPGGPLTAPARHPHPQQQQQYLYGVSPAGPPGQPGYRAYDGATSQPQPQWLNGQFAGPGQSSALPPPYDDPANLLRVYPIATYTPTARVASHFYPNTTTYSAPSTSTQLYPQHAADFQQLDNPTSAADWQARQAAEQQIQALMRQNQNQSYMAQSCSPFPNFTAQHDPSLPMPYAFTSNYMPPPDLQTPPTPSSLSPFPSAPQFFEQYVDRFVASGQAPQAHAGTMSPAQLHNPRPIATDETRGPLSFHPVTTPPSQETSAAMQKATAAREQRTAALVTPSTPKLAPAATPQAGPSQLSPLPRKAPPVQDSPDPTIVSNDEEDDEDEELDWGAKEDADGDWVMDGRMRSPSPVGMAIPTSGRTGERDMRSAFQKLQSYMEDVFEESDSFSAEPTFEDVLQSRFFANLAKNDITPLLSIDTIARLTRYTTRVHAAGERQRRLPQSEKLEWDVESAARLLRLLDRSMVEAEGVTPFPDDGKAATFKSGKGKKGKAKTEGDVVVVDDSLVSAEAANKATARMRTLLAGGAAALCALVVWDADTVPKQLYSEDILSRAVTTTRDLMTKAVFPVIAGLAGEKVSSSYLAQLVQDEADGKGRPKLSPYFKHPQLSSIAQIACTAIPHIANLISRSDFSFSEQLVIQTVYLAIGPVFIAEPAGKKGKKEATGNAGTGAVIKTLRMEALACLRGAFAKYEAQRKWIIEEILGSLVKISEQSNAQTRFQLADGSSIHVLSALLLQLIQASAHGVAARVRKLRASILELEAMDKATDKLATAEEEARICAMAVDEALTSTRAIAVYLFQRSASSKSTKTSLDTDYKIIFETLVADLLAVLYRPEWPAASLYLNVLSKLMMTALEEGKASGELAAAKHLALDQLGDIAARLRGLHIEMLQDRVATLEEVILDADVDACSRLIKAHSAIRSYLSTASRSDGMYESSDEVTRIMWAQELQTALTKTTSVIESYKSEKDEEAVATRERLQAIAQQLRTALRDVWATDDGLFEISDLNSASIARQASLAVARSQSLQNAFEPVVHALVGAMDTNVVMSRQKALRGIGCIVTVDPDVLELPAVKLAIQDRLSDPSAAVRDPAVELIGKYVVQRSNLAAVYYPFIADRTTDTGLNVRKRVIKILRGIFTTVADRAVKVDICARLVGMVGDEDDNIKDLASKALAEMLFPPGSAVNESAALLVDMISEFPGSSAALEPALQSIGVACDKNGHKDRFGDTIEALIRRLVDATEQIDFDAPSHIRAIYLLSASQPALIDTDKARVLLTYLHPPSNADEQAANDLLLRIFRRCIPQMPRASSTFANDLAKQLMPMIGKPTGGLSALKETIGCFCAVVTYLTKDYAKLISVLRSCEAKLRIVEKQMAANGPAVVNNQATSMVMYITALIAEYGDLEAVAASDRAVRAELSKITKEPLSEYLFDLFLNFANAPGTGSAPSLCLGSLFHAHPKFAVREATIAWMRNVFTAADPDNRARLFVVIHDFLFSEAQRKNGAKRQEDKDVEALIGNAIDLEESGVSTTLVQANIDYILDGAKSHHEPLRDAAMDVLAFTVKQGLYHPLLCLPILISLETSDIPAVADRALALHADMHSKHPSLINVSHLDFARASYDYQKTISSEVSGQRRGDALLAGWYGLVSEKRAWRNDFLRAMTRTFDVDLGGQDKIDTGFVLYIAENLASFEYKIQEEAMSIVQVLSGVVSSNIGVANMLDTTQLDGDEEEPVEGKVVRVSDSEVIDAARLIDASIVIGLALLTKNHLLDLYSLSEEKCLKLVPGKKSAQGDRAATRKSPGLAALEWGRMPSARGVNVAGEWRAQQAAFLELLREDGSLDAQL
ncbi:Sister chromatid cohesion protein 2 [Cryptotrichosporon argae]